MIEFKRFVAARLADIQRQIDELPEYDQSGRAGVSLGLDLSFYQVGLEVLEDFESERAHSRLQASRAFTARLNRAGMGRAHESEAKRL